MDLPVSELVGKNDDKEKKVNATNLSRTGVALHYTRTGARVYLLTGFGAATIPRHSIE
jgi:hypothetical protein